MHLVKIGNLTVGKKQPLTFMSGPCVIESEEHTLRLASELKKIFDKFPVQFIFKACYDKANRTSIHSYRGPGIEEGLQILQKVKREIGVPVISDIHLPEEAPLAKEVLDVLQIPAFLCRQTDLLVAAAKTQKPIHIKKGQFVAPHDMGNVIKKITECENYNIMVADRGTCFGYNNLVCDFRAIPIMQKFGFPVIFDASHSVQLPGAEGTVSGGQREFIPTLAQAAVSAGCQGIFIETHDAPESAKSDAALVFPIQHLAKLVDRLVRLYEIVNE
jgi:2-dehydro-3-deoxyphosphooctonate aldolase (KDO 8-P synthase)